MSSVLVKTGDAHKCKYDTRVKRKIPIQRHGATARDPRPGGIAIGFDYILLWKCACGKTQAYDLVREAI